MAKQKSPEEASEDEIVKDVCLANGLVYNQLPEEGPKCTFLEMFFSGYPRIVGLQHFPNLEVLVIMGQNITKMEGLDQVPRLRELWISEGRLKKIEGLDHLKCLKKLCLYENQIEKIANLDLLSSLEILWLNNNCISAIQELSSLKNLKELNLAENRIEKIGNSLNSLTALERLDLSGNCINSFRDLTNLVKLPSLTHLGLKMPCYHSSPVGLLCNYSTYILYHLPNLEYLDGSDIMCQTLKQLAETTVRKKKMFYNMKMKTLYRNLTEVKARLTVTKQEILKVPHERIKKLFHVLKEIDLELHLLKSEEDLEKHESETESDKDARETKAEEERSTVELYKSKQRAIREKIKRWEHKCAEIEYYYQESLERMRQTAEGTVHRLLTELETGGNVRFEDGIPSCLWFSSCHDLVLSRFCAADYKDYGILGIKIHRITRVHNRMLRSRFDDAFSTHVDDDDSPFFVPKNPGYKNLLEYLFWIWDPEVPGGQTDVARILEDGFPDANTYKQLGKEAAVPLTNSLSLADHLRMQHLIRQNQDKEFPEACPFRFGQLVVCKVFIGNCVSTIENKQINQRQYPTADSIFRPKKDNAPKSPEGSVSATVHSMMTTKSPCECGSRQSEWFIFNHELVVPEYIIDFEYITRHQPRSPFITHHHEMTLLERKHRPLCLVEEFPNDEDVLELRPAIKPRSRLIGLSESVMLKISKARAITNIQYLNLHGNGLTKVKEVQALPRLKRLVLSFNELTRLDELAHLNLEYIDASFNQLVTLEGLKSMNSLLFLDVSWNNLTNTRDEMSVLRKYMPVLSVLDIRHNNWQKPEGLRLRIIGRLKTLTKLDGSVVGDEETAAALRMAAGSRISQVSLLMQSRTDTEPLRTLSLQTHAHTLTQYSNKKPDRAVDLDNNWYLKVTTLNLDGQHISKLSNLERLENLQWASFNNNDLTKIEGLDNCLKLEELSLESNCITRIEGLTKLDQLRHLNLSHNYIDCLEHTGFERLPHLHYLDLEDNCITSLLGLQKALSLTELYISNNLVESVREIFYLKGNSNLVIIDIFGNPAASSVDNYRLFVIYHLKMLKALDGKSVESTEVSQAKDMFGGRLTQDFVAEKLCVSDFNKLMELDFPNMNIRSIDLGHGDTFLNLRSVNLEHNNLTSFGGLVYLLNLKVLCLNHNHIDCIVPRPRQQNAVLPRGRVAGSPMGVIPSDSCTQLLEKLEVLHLGYNGIKDIASLQLFRLPSLKALFLQGNEIVKVEGLDALHELRELVLDRNRIKSISDMSFSSQWQLQELHLEENRLRELTNITVLNNLKRLFLGMNRIQDFGELDKLESMSSLVELSLVSNAVARRMLHRPLLIYRMQNLKVIDGIPVMDEERAKAEMYFTDLQPAAPISTTMEATLPGLGAYKTHVSMKVTNMQLVSYTDKMWSSGVCLSDDGATMQNQQEFQRGVARRRGYGRTEPLQGIQPITSKPPGTYTVPQFGHNKASPQQISQVNYLPQYQHNNDSDNNRFQKNPKR